jgi:hypothetical protein
MYDWRREGEGEEKRLKIHALQCTRVYPKVSGLSG